MTLRRAWLIAALFAAATGPAAAQFQPVAPPAQQQAPPCFAEFSEDAQ